MGCALSYAHYAIAKLAVKVYELACVCIRLPLRLVTDWEISFDSATGQCKPLLSCDAMCLIMFVDFMFNDNAQLFNF